MTNRSKSTLFLIEQLIVIAVFAICAVACISILTASYFYANDGSAVSNAIIKAESGAEVFKVTGSDFTAAADILGGSITSETSAAGGVSVLSVYYDSSWQICSESNASYVLHLVIESVQGTADFEVITGRVTVGRISGEELISLKAAARNF